MSGTHLPQTRRAIQALLDAGYRRSEFSVLTPCRRGEYQDTRIYVWAPVDRQDRRLPFLLQTNQVDVYYDYIGRSDGSLRHFYCYSLCYHDRSSLVVQLLQPIFEKES